MRKNDKDIVAFQELLIKYRFTEPVPPEVRQRFVADNRKMLVRVLKSVGAFSALYGIYLAVTFALKKITIGITLSKIIVSTVAAASISYGGYYAVVKITDPSAEKAEDEQKVKKKDIIKEETHPKTLEDIREKYGQIEELVLFNGIAIQGAVLSRGNIYRVYTLKGVLTVPSDKIKMIKPL